MIRLIILFLFAPVFLLAQDTIATDSSHWISHGMYPIDEVFKPYHWLSQPVLHPLTAEEEKLDAVVILDRRIVEYVSLGYEYARYYTVHRIIRINSDKAISKYNRLYVPWGNVTGNNVFKIRTISPSGTVTNTAESSIKLVENYENLGAYKIAAIDGIEKGSEVEIWYQVKTPVFVVGTEHLDEKVRYRTFNFIVMNIGPSNMKVKAYNMEYDRMVVKSTRTSNGGTQIVAKNIGPISPEATSPEDAASPRIDYTGFENDDKDKLAERAWTNFSGKYNKGNISNARKLIKKNKLKGKTNAETAEAIELWIKKNYVFTDQRNEKFEMVTNIMRNKIMNEKGSIALSIVFLEAANIPFELVATTNRFSRQFDADFLTLNSFQKTFIYIPESELMFDPSDYASRKSFIDFRFTCQPGAFVSYNHATNRASLRVADMPCFDCYHAKNDIDARVQLDLDMQQVNIHYKQSYLGNYASGYQPYYKTLSDDRKKKMTDDILKSVADDVQISNLVVSGSEEKDWYVQPFAVEADLKSNNYLEKAGPKYLFKIGNLIGPQQEMYQEGERKTSIEEIYNRRYYRTLSFDIPEGYRVANLDKLKMETNNADSTGNMTVRFTSDYTVEGNTVNVKIEEYYKQVRFPVEEYEVYRKVINAAADFNKIVLFLEKK